MLRLASIVTSAFLLLTACAQTSERSERASPSFMISTGGSTGVYYVLGQSICMRYDEIASADLPDCNAPASGGSVPNLKALADGSADMAIAYSVWAKQAAEGTSGIAGLGRMEDLRAIASFYPEPLNLLVRRDTGINSLNELTKARLGMPENSWGTVYFRIVMQAKGWAENSFASVRYASSAKAALDSLCRGDVDAIPIATGHPSGNVKRATESCGAKLLTVTEPAVTDEIAGDLALAPAKVSADTYSGQNQSVMTFGPRPLLVTRADTPDALVHAVAEAIFSDLEAFKKQSPVFLPLTKEEMVSVAIPIPLHPAAAAYYREIGLLN